MSRLLRGLITLAFLFASTVPLFATQYTPLKWQKRVVHHANVSLIGQRKHLTWVRDQNRNFIDDLIEQKFHPGDTLNIIVDLNECMPPGKIKETFSRYGQVTYIGKLITFVMLNKVKFADIAVLAARPDVAMIEWQTPTVMDMDIATRAVEARSDANATVPFTSAESLGLNGNGVNIAVIDSGVNDTVIQGLSNKFVAGFDAWDPADNGDGTRNPTDQVGNHGTTMAVVAMGANVNGKTCRNPGPGNLATCAGIAPGAKLVDVNRCATTVDAQGAKHYNCDDTFAAKGIDWVGANATKFNIRVVIMAFTECGDDDGTSAVAQQANYLAALGLVVSASYGNAANSPDCQTVAGDRVNKAPGSASFAISVNASDDKGTIDRGDDTIFDAFLIGPRRDFNAATPELTALKPDLSAPGKNLSALEVFQGQPTVFVGIDGTSPASAIVAGAAALIIQKFPAIDPGSVKDLLISSVDNTRNMNQGTFSTWDDRLGWGLLRVGTALQMAQTRADDVSFPNCQSPSTAGNGQPCSLKDGNPNWLNTQDITTSAAPHVGIANNILVNVVNNGASDAKVLVNFGVYIFGAGSPQFHHLGSQQVTLHGGQTMQLSEPWTPAASDHQCAQISIAFGLDADYSNNVTQRNLQVSPSVYNVRVENPLMVPAHFEIKAKSDRQGWVCKVADPVFDLDPFNDCARNVRVTFDAPAGTPPGQRANCNIAVHATPQGAHEGKIIGGVTVQTYVPKPCRMFGEVVNSKGNPVAGAVITVVRAAPAGTIVKADLRTAAVTAISDADGVFVVQVIPQVLQTITVQSPEGKGQITIRPECGLGLPRLILHRQDLTAVDRLTGLPVSVADGNLVPTPSE